MQVDGPALDAQVECEQILRSVPQWFGIEDSRLMYARDTATMPTFLLRDGERALGFISLRAHFPHAWEIHCVAIHAEARRQGLGKTLLAHAEQWLKAQGAWLLQVKTIAASSPNPHYAQTRVFYERMGFVSFEVFPDLWAPSNPCLQMLKVLGGTRV